MVTIQAVTLGSLCAQKGVRAGDVLTHVNGKCVQDGLDYRFFVTETHVTLSLLRGGKPYTVTLEKDEYEDIGLEFETFLMDEKHCCENNCIFCFIDQNPPGMRETIYFKDDDTRLSFLHGNYVTLTNCSQKDLDRIVLMRLSPVNVSVHTTNGALRAQMLANPNAAAVLDQLRFLSSHGILLNCQIVLCRGINDGAELKRSLKDLLELGECVQSIAVVPAGLTRFREGLPTLVDYDEVASVEVIDLVDAFCASRKDDGLGRRVFIADEFYVRAHRPLPPAEHYEGYPQLDNGVGLLRSLEEDVEFALEQAPRPQKKRNYLLLTGCAAYEFLKDLTARILDGQELVTCDVVSVTNRFYGESVTVSGLLTASDYLFACEGLDLSVYDAVLISASSLRHERDLFLDGMSLSELSKCLQVPVIPVEAGEDIVEKLLGGK